MINLGDRTPDIDYPCSWTYRLIGESQQEIRALVTEILGDSDHELEHSHDSRNGRYVSLKLTLVVRNDMHRLMLYRRLSGCRAIKYVL